MATNNTKFSAAGLGREVILQPSTAIAAANVDQFDIQNIPAGVEGVFVVINVTAVASTPSVVFRLQGVDGNTGLTWDILTSAAVTATGQTVLRIHPNLPAVANLTAQDMVPPKLRVQATHANANSITYSVTAELSY